MMRKSDRKVRNVRVLGRPASARSNMFHCITRHVRDGVFCIAAHRYPASSVALYPL
jgi:hypothetical protein